MKELGAFVEATLQMYPTLWSVYDSNWRSPCEVGDPVEHNGALAVPWRPSERFGADDFNGLERAFEAEIHPSVKDFYGMYWSGCLEAEAEEGHVSLILLWNPEDRDRLLENLIGHALNSEKVSGSFEYFLCLHRARIQSLLGSQQFFGRSSIGTAGL